MNREGAEADRVSRHGRGLCWGPGGSHSRPAWKRGSKDRKDESKRWTKTKTFTPRKTFRDTTVF